MMGVMFSQPLRRMLCGFVAAMTAALPVLGDVTNQAQALASGNNAFAFDLYARLKGGDGNLFFSPYSISTCLAMTYAGARGDTEKQMAMVFHFDGQERTHAAFAELQAQLNAVQAKKKIELDIANGLWAQQGKAFLPEFLNIAQTRYDAKVEQADFKTAAEAVRKSINDWVSDKTKGKITDLFGPGTVGPETRLVLANAIYFKAPWISPFMKGRTSEAPFHAGADKSAKVPMMSQAEDFMYGEDEGLQILELGYANRDVSMLVLLPRAIDGLKSLEGRLNEPQLTNWLAKLRVQKVNLFLPKFKLSSEFQLDKTLAKMGMPDAFSRAADFSGMDGTRQLLISAVVHKAFVDVTEEGTEAAAATGVAMRPMAIRREKPVEFRADHPFIFLIRDTHSRSVLFLGRLTEPAK
jgi:serine protease inhibitor